MNVFMLIRDIVATIGWTIIIGVAVAHSIRGVKILIEHVKERANNGVQEDCCVDEYVSIEDVLKTIDYGDVCRCCGILEKRREELEQELLKEVFEEG